MVLLYYFTKINYKYYPGITKICGIKKKMQRMITKMS